MGSLSLTHILLIAVVFLIFFGPSRLPQLGQSLGKAIRGFKQGLSEIDVDAKDIHDNPQVKQAEQEKTKNT
jgi:sec-independent protein translocase protein TatA